MKVGGFDLGDLLAVSNVERLERKASVPDVQQVLNSIEPVEGETARCLALPEVWEYHEAATIGRALRRPNATWTLNVVQAPALAAIARCGGFLGPIAVGWGKTLVAALAGAVLGIEDVVILMPANMLGAFGKELSKIKQQFRTPRNIKLISYEMFSRPEGTDMLERLAPPLIVCDEVHCLRNPTAARTMRFTRYMDAHPTTAFVGLSGTVTSRGLNDYAHLLKYALKDRSPVPRFGVALSAWSRCVDADGRPGPMDWYNFAPVVRAFGDPPCDIEGLHGAARQTAARMALQRRLLSSEGVVATDAQSCGSTIIMKTVDLAVPSDVAEAFKTVLEFGESPDGDEVYEDDVAVWRATRQLSCGFFYRWAWEEVGGRDEDWLSRRKQWNRFLRAELKAHARQGYDSPALVERSILADMAADPSITDSSDLHFIYKEWAEVKDRVVPPTVPVWLSDFFIDDLVDRLNRAKTPTIAWYESDAVEQALTARGIRVYGQGSTPPSKAETCAMSTRVHGTGKNLQAWHHNLIVEPASSGTVWEQKMGRTHRQGQMADEVYYSVYQHTDSFRKALESAVEQAKYVYETQGAQQKLLIATWI